MIRPHCPIPDRGSGEWTDIGLTASDRRNHFNDLRLTVMALYVLSMLSGSG